MLGSTQVAGIRAEVFHGNWYNFKFQDDIRMKLVDEAGVDKALKKHGIKYLIFSDFYGEPEIRNLVKNRTTEIFRLGYISVRLFEQDSLELLTNLILRRLAVGIFQRVLCIELKLGK